MYESFYGFTERPFAVTPLAKRYFPGAAIELARQTLGRCTQRAEGIGLLIGPAGTGKSLLCQVLVEQFRGEMEVAFLSSGRLANRRALLQAILFELGLPFREQDEGDLRLSLIDHLSRRSSASEAALGLLLMVDEAHTLPLRLLEELRLITNLVRNGQPRVRLVLAGGPQLEERFASPKLESFNQRVAARCYLEAFDRAQTIDYVKHTIKQVSGDPTRVFTPDALEAIYTATDGVPRLVNQVCDHALLLASAGGVQQLSAAGIEEAWSDLQQLPTPWNAAQGAKHIESAGSVIEFGSLADDPTDDLPAAVPFRTASTDLANDEMSPLERLKQITAQLARIDDVQTSQSTDDFQPAGSIVPEIELVLKSVDSPFQGVFDEEEVVIDRYSTIETDALANRPLVRSSASRELGSLLAQAEVPATRPMPAIAPATWPGGVPETQSTAPAVDPRQRLETNLAAHANAAEISEHLPHVVAAQAQWAFEPVLTVAPISVPTLDLSAQPGPVSMELELVTSVPPTIQGQIPVNDDNLIVIEDPPEATIPLTAKAPARARRKEYRQLFAQLRRG